VRVPASLDRGEATPVERQALFGALLVVLSAMRGAGMIGQTLRLTSQPPPPFGEGSQGKHVAIWQTVVGAKVDDPAKGIGIFGPKTRAATEAWSEKAGFGKRAIVNEAMWTVAIGLTLGLGETEVVLPSGEPVPLAGLAEYVAGALKP